MDTPLLVAPGAPPSGAGPRCLRPGLATGSRPAARRAAGTWLSPPGPYPSRVAAALPRRGAARQ
eukprot:6866686-Alexandrium_andersonii.AAC.1